MIVSLFAAAILTPPLALDLRVQGEGYLRFAYDGRIVYAKSAKLAVIDGRLQTSWGGSTMPLVEIPKQASRLDAEPNGTLVALIGTERKVIGKMLIATFAPNVLLTSEGEYFVARSRPTLKEAGSEGIGTLVAGLGTATITPTAPLKTPETGPSSAYLAQIAIPATVVLEAPRILVGSLGSIEAKGELKAKIAEIDFGPAPRVGFPVKLARTRIIARLKLIGIKDGQYALDMPETVEVKAPFQLIDAAQFEEAARSALATSVEDIKLPVSTTPMEAPLGNLELRVESTVIRRDQISATVAVYVDGKRHAARTLSLTGTPIAPAVKANEMVKVRLITRGVSIETTGKVKKDGRVGEKVEVVIHVGTEPTTHVGTVKSAGAIEVEL
jgi:hypothetical protein